MCCSPRFLPGLALVAALATVAVLIGSALPVLGAPVVALAIGAAVGVARRRAVDEDGVFGPGLEWTRQRVLGAAIVLLGLGLPFGAVLSVGRQTAVVLAGTVVVGAVAALLVGRMLAMDRQSATLIAVGTTICGASAIAAATAVLRPDRERVAYALGTIFVFNVVAVLVFPPVGRMLGMSQEAFGLWAGTAINDTSSVLAAGTIFGAAAAQFAVIVKLVRSLLIVPMCVGLHLGSRGASGAQRAAWRTIPLFVVLFVAASVIAGLGVVPESWAEPLSRTSTWLIAAVLAAIGTSLSWRRIRSAGVRPLVFGGALGLVLALSCLALQRATGWW
ncbi:putative sulfate exporter family transporter [Nocardia puris]|uniref:Putative integral membrane protein (TIGR00698 family) n=1 Tax=Nocardia puris TaxID=208602 RepID=A0A366E4Q6_9NOCA|nr:putative sulfate exporter family transporter [Nocardia puris]MBF6212687.1 putative sulfate exporter family transporter [Nocardia puris]MBF6367625.1 putative sulfate exporter family transporter [Nocardia puris]MBF6461276.1 putative sulfate exporter family transporter [Nocardia puris]RBO96494.1 putative integral membrane protein (TIGR00698 family) [Nocardia puris]